MARKKDETMVMEEGNDGELRVYELGFHLDPELPTEEVKKAYASIRGTLSTAGMIVAEVEPEKIKLAYTISLQGVDGRRDFNSAYFAWIVYEMTAGDHAEILKALRGQKSIVRFIDLVTTKEAARHALEVHELSKKAPEPEPAQEDVLATELDAALEEAAV